MKPYILSALLLASTAAAGGAEPRPMTVQPVRLAPVSAPIYAAPTGSVMTVTVPALPLGGMTVAPSAPVVTAPAAVGQRLSVTAPVGTSVALQQTITDLKLHIDRLEATGALKESLEADGTSLEEMVSGLNEMFADPEMMKEMGAATAPITVKVGQRLPSGAVELVTSTQMELPADAENPEETKAYTLNVIQTIEPNGTVGAVRIESDNEMVAALFAGFDRNMLSQLGSGTESGAIYELPLTAGATVTKTSEIDIKKLVSGMVRGLMTPEVLGEGELDPEEVEVLLNTIEAAPMQSVVTTVYKGQNAQGLYTFESRGVVKPWAMTMDLGKLEGMEDMGKMVFKLSLLDNLSVVNSHYRADGLPAQLLSKADMRLAFDMETSEGNLSGEATVALTSKAE